MLMKQVPACQKEKQGVGEGEAYIEKKVHSYKCPLEFNPVLYPICIIFLKVCTVIRTIWRSENFEKINFLTIQSGITVNKLFDMENVIWNQI